MDYDRQAERLYRIANACKDMNGPLRQISQDLSRLRSAEGDELVAQFQQAVEGFLALEKAARERMIADYPGHLMSDLAPKEIESIARRRREILASVSGNH
jgi:hypothetical protein